MYDAILSGKQNFKAKTPWDVRRKNLKKRRASPKGKLELLNVPNWQRREEAKQVTQG